MKRSQGKKKKHVSAARTVFLLHLYTVPSAVFCGTSELRNDQTLSTSSCSHSFKGEFVWEDE